MVNVILFVMAILGLVIVIYEKVNQEELDYKMRKRNRKLNNKFHISKE